MSGSIYLKEATLAELLVEVARRFEERNPMPAWADTIVFSVAAYYGLYPDQLRGHSRDEAIVKARHLAIALMARLNPSRPRAEICAVLARGHEMYTWALNKTDERANRFPSFREEIREILKIINHAHSGDAHCRTAPQGTPDRSAAAAS